jgi:hypothetical protein
MTECLSTLLSSGRIVIIISRYNKGHWIEGGTQSSISSKAQFWSRGFVEGEE